MIQLIKDQLTAAGTDTYTSALITKYTSLQKGIYIVTFTNANTGASTLNIDGLGAVPLVDSTGSAIASAFIGAGKTFMLIYDGTNFIITGSASTSGFELIANKAIDFSILNNILYPSVQAVNSRILSLISGLAPYFYYKTVSDIGGSYYEMKGIPSTGGAQSISSAGVTNNQILATFVTVAGVPGVTSIATGVIKFNAHATQTAGTKTTQLYAEVYKRNLAGTETLISTSAYSSVVAGVDADYNFDASIGTLVTLLTTDRIVTKIRALVAGGGSTPDITISIEDNTAARTEMPFAPVSAQGSTGTGALVYNIAPTLVTPSLGTPSALVGTNITGTASGLTAGNVTTNANLTGAITSVGNATSLGSFTSAQLLSALTDETGSGVAVFNNTPTLIAPVLGNASATTLLMAGEPTLALQVATKSYVDNLINGLKFKQDVVAASTANVNIASAPTTLDSVTLVSLDRVLLKNQSTASENGIYQFNGAASALTRTLDADTGAELVAATIPVRGGTTNQDTWWTITNDTITIGVTSIVLTQTGGAGTYVSGTGLSLAGNVFSIDSTVVTLTGSQVLTNKTLTTPTINGGTHTGITSFGIKSTAAAFDMKIANVTAITADRTLTIDTGDANRTVNFLGGTVTFNNSFTTGAAPITLTTTNTTNVTLPTSGTLYGTATGSITSLQLLTSLSDETGTGANVFGTSPDFTTSITTASATFSLFNTGATTVNAFGAATALNIGGTPTTAITHNYSTNATATGTTKTANFGTGGVSGSTTAINIGSAVSGATNNIKLNVTPASDTTGDIFYRNVSGFLTRLGIGSSGQVLTVTTGLPSWATPTTGTVSSVSVTTANGVSGSVATATTTPAITLTLGAITPTSINGVVLSGSATPTLSVTGTTSVSGTNTGDQTNISGNAATVTTNANLTGHITSVGNVTVLGTSAFSSLNLLNALTSYTGTGANVFGTSPTFVTSLITSSSSFNLFNTVATTVSMFQVASQVDFANLTTTQVMNFGCGITATGQTKSIFIGTNGVTGSSTTIQLGTANGGVSSTIYLNADVINLSGKTSTFTGHNINVGSDASYDMWHRGTGTGLTRIANGTTGQVLMATSGAAPAFAFVVPRQTNLTSSATPTPNLDNEDQLNITALAVGATIGAPTGTFVGARKLIIRIKDNGTSQTLAYNAIFRVVGVVLPTATVINKTIYLGCIYNAADTKWDAVAYQIEV